MIALGFGPGSHPLCLSLPFLATASLVLPRRLQLPSAHSVAGHQSLLALTGGYGLSQPAFLVPPAAPGLPASHNRSVHGVAEKVEENKVFWRPDPS